MTARRPPDVRTVVAFAVALGAIGLLVLPGLVVDPTPLLAEPSPNLDLPLGLVGLGAGLWSARRIAALPYVASRRAGRAALWIMLPLWLIFGLASLGDRAFELFSFRGGGSLEQATVLVVEKDRSLRRRGPDVYELGVASPIDDRVVDVRVDRATYDRAEPNRECATLLIERAPNGAARLVRPLRWKARCPSAQG